MSATTKQTVGVDHGAEHARNRKPVVARGWVGRHVVLAGRGMARLDEIGILGHDGKAAITGELEDLRIGGSIESVGENVRRVGKDIAQPGHECGRQIVVEEQPQERTTRVERSRSAAYSRQARMSSSVR